jgi:hypothetical protein
MLRRPTFFAAAPTVLQNNFPASYQFYIPFSWTELEGGRRVERRIFSIFLKTQSFWTPFLLERA